MRTLIRIVAMVMLIFASGCSKRADDLQGGVLYVVFDASAENFNCDPLRESNLEQIKSFLQSRPDDYTTVVAAVFSRNYEVIADTTKESHLPDRIVEKRFRTNAMKVIEMAYEAMEDFYAYRSGGEEHLYGRDVEGMLKSVVQEIQERYVHRRVTVLIASTMLQSVNKETVKSRLKRRHIVLPEDTKIIVYQKSWVCRNDVSEQMKIESVGNTRRFWQEVIEGDIRFYTRY